MTGDEARNAQKIADSIRDDLVLELFLLLWWELDEMFGLEDRHAVGERNCQLADWFPTALGQTFVDGDVVAVKFSERVDEDFGVAFVGVEAVGEGAESWIRVEDFFFYEILLDIIIIGVLRRRLVQCWREDVCGVVVVVLRRRYVRCLS